ncbi:S24 family peptidase [Psychrilyobacter sp.]|uniref:XRE family transcriptional regulator n=1 Tax=Psychrilyobacter sp. TaxID=2586924 RepID=UPI00301B2C9A
MELSILLKQLREEKKLTMKELAAKSGISISTIGEIERGANKSRPRTLEKLAVSLELTEEKRRQLFLSILPDNVNDTIKPNAKIIKTRKVPMYGTASAGPGYLNLNEEIDEDFEVPDEDYKKGRFTVKVEGNSMSGVGDRTIPCGSIALVDPVMCEGIEGLIGKVCVFTYNDETYIKQLEVDNQNLIHLVSFNQDISDIIILDREELKCEGRVVSTYWKRKW